MLELPLAIAAEDALTVCRSRGLVVVSHRQLAGRPGSHHWHLHRPGHAGTLEVSEWEGRAWVKVHPLREGTWATPFAHDLASMGPGMGR